MWNRDRRCFKIGFTTGVGYENARYLVIAGTDVDGGGL